MTYISCETEADLFDGFIAYDPQQVLCVHLWPGEERIGLIACQYWCGKDVNIGTSNIDRYWHICQY